MLMVVIPTIVVLSLDIETNGAVQAKEALAMASKMLIDYLDVIVQISEQAVSTDFIFEQEEEPTNKSKEDATIVKALITVSLYAFLIAYAP